MKSRKRNIKLKDRIFWEKYVCGFGGKIRKYLIEEFELEGFTKEIDDINDGWASIIFRRAN